jgi:hypothetical protein
MRATAERDHKIRTEGNANLLASLQDAGVRRYLLQSGGYWYAPGAGLADESAPFAFDASPAVAAGARRYADLEAAAAGTSNVELRPDSPARMVARLRARGRRTAAIANHGRRGTGRIWPRYRLLCDPAPRSIEREGEARAEFSASPFGVARTSSVQSVTRSLRRPDRINIGCFHCRPLGISSR